MSDARDNERDADTLWGSSAEHLKRRRWAELIGELVLDCAEVQYLVDRLVEYYAPNPGERRNVFTRPLATRLSQAEDWVRAQESSHTRRSDLLAGLRQATTVMRARERLVTSPLRLQLDQAGATAETQRVLALDPSVHASHPPATFDQAMLRVLSDEAREVRFALERSVANLPPRPAADHASG